MNEKEKAVVFALTLNVKFLSRYLERFIEYYITPEDREIPDLFKASEEVINARIQRRLVLHLLKNPNILVRNERIEMPSELKEKLRELLRSTGENE